VSVLVNVKAVFLICVCVYAVAVVFGLVAVAVLVCRAGAARQPILDA